MPEATPAPTPPAPTQAAPPNGTPPPAPKEGAPPAQAKPNEPSVDQRLAELEKATKRAAWEGMKRAQEMKKERESLEMARKQHEADLKEVAEYKRLREDRKRNPTKYLQQDWGEDWHETINRIRLEGGKATPELVASEVEDKVGGVKSEMEKKLAALEAKLAEKDKEAQAKEAQAWRNNWEASLFGDIEKLSDKHKAVNALLKDPKIGQGFKADILSTIEGHFQETSKTDEETGEQIPGELLTADAAAERMETRLKDLYAVLHKALSPTPQQAAPDARPRRSLTTDLTATQTSIRPSATTDAERMQRALAKLDEIEAQRRAARQ